MTSVDNRIVHMTFDNATFEQKIAQTMGSLDKLKTSLDFSGSKKSMSDLGESVGKFHMGGMIGAIENVSNKFLTLSTIGITAIANITSRAVSAAFDITKAFTFGPIQAGFAEMETNMNSIQTIMSNTSSKGSTLEDVNAALEKLNTYSDQTIYNFSQMARNIGTFTAAGVDLDTSVNSIKGIANLAAISGSNADQASTAMYQLSQALASGSVKLMDWNSVVNAGMGGEIFQKALFETGKSLGTIADVPMDQTFDQWKDAGNSFRSSLEDGWITAEVLTNTLQGFTGDLDKAQLVALGYTDAQADEMIKLGALGKAAATEVKTLTQLLGTVKESVGSGWSKTFQIVIGDFNEAKELFTSINTAIGGFVSKQADARNALLQGWKDLGGRTKLIEALKEAFNGLATIIKPIKDAFREIFPPVTAERLFELTERFAEFTKKIAITGKTADKIKEIFKGVFSAVEIGIEVIKQVARGFKELFSSLVSGTSGGVLDFFVNISEKVQDLKKVLVDEGGIKKFIDNLIGFFKDPLPVIEGFIDNLKGAFQELVSVLLFGDFTGKGPWEEDSPIINGLFKFRDTIVNFFKNPIPSIKGFIDNIKGLFQEVLSIFLFDDFTGKGPWEEDSPIVAGLFKFRDIVAGIFGKIGDVIGKVFGVELKVPDFLSSFGDKVNENTTNSLAGGFERLGDRLSTFWDILKKVWDVLGKIADAIQWMWDKLSGFVSWATTTFFDIFEAIFDFAKNIGPNLQKAFMSEEFDRFLDFLDTVALLLGGSAFSKIAKNGLGLNVDLTGGALPKLGELFKSLSGTLPAVKRNIEGLTGVFSAMQTEIKANALMKIAIAIGILTASVLVLSMIDPAALAKALTAIAVGFGELAGTMAILQKMGSGPKGSADLATLGVAMIAISTALLILSAAVRVLAGLGVADLATGLAGVTGVMLIMASAAKLMGGSSVMLVAAGVGMVAMATAMVIMAGAVKLFSLMDWKEIGKGLAVITALLGVLAIAINTMPASTVLIGPGLVAVAIAMNILAGALVLFNTMSWKEIGKGMVVLLGSLLILSAALGSMGPSVLLVGPGLIAVGIALNLLGAALKIMGSMSMKEIGKSLLVLFGSLLILSAAMSAMTTALPGAIALGVVAVSLMLLSKVLKEFAKLKLKELGMGLLAIVAVLAALGLMAAALSPVLGAMIALGIALTAIGVGFALFGLGASLIAEAFQIIAAAGTAGIDVLMYAIDQFMTRLPEMATFLAQSVLNFVQMILDAIPALIIALGKIVASFIDVLIDLVPKFIELGVAYGTGFLEAIRKLIPDLVKTGVEFILALLEGIRDNIDHITTVVLEIVANFLDAVADNLDEIIDAGVNILVSLLEGIAENIDDIAEAAGDIIEAFIEGIVGMYGDIADAGTNAIVEFLEGIGDNARELARAAGTFVTDFMDAIADEFVDAVDRAARIVIDFLNDLADVIRENDDKIGKAMGNLGSAIMEGIIVGLTSMAGEFIDACIDIAKDALAAMAKPWEWFSPSHTMVRLGNDIIEGLIIGLEGNSSNLNNSIGDISEGAVDSFQKAIDDAALSLEGSEEFQPTITPVLDLTNVNRELANFVGGGVVEFGGGVSLAQARLVSEGRAQLGEGGVIDTQSSEPREVKFEQNIYSPQTLNTATIYRQTRNQIELAKKELEIV